MKKYRLVIVLLAYFLIGNYYSYAQVGIGTSNPKSMLHVEGNVLISELKEVSSQTIEYDRVLVTKSDTSNHLPGEKDTTGVVYFIPLKRFKDYDGVDRRTKTLKLNMNLPENVIINNSTVIFKNVEFRVKKYGNAPTADFEVEWRPRNFINPETDKYYKEAKVYASVYLGGVNWQDSSGAHTIIYADKSSGGEFVPLYAKNVLNHLNDKNSNGQIYLSVFGTYPSSNRYESLYKIRYAYLNHFDLRILGVVIQELAAPNEKLDLTDKNALWISGLFSGIYGVSNYPRGIEIYLNNQNITWDIAKHYQIRIGNKEMVKLFKNEDEFNKMKKELGNHPFMYFWYGTAGDFGTKLFPKSVYGSRANLREKRFSLGGKEGVNSVCLYYKGVLVDAFGDGIGETTPNYEKGWAKRKPNTEPTNNGVYNANDWVVKPKAFEPDDTIIRYYSNNKVNFSFPFGNQEGCKHNPTPNPPQCVPGYTKN